MRSLPQFVIVGLIALALGFTARNVRSSPHGTDIWNIRLDTSSSDHWILLAAGRVRDDGRTTSVFLLGHPKEDAPPNRYDAMKVVGGSGGAALWTYDGLGSDYVDASGLVPEHASDAAGSAWCAPRLEDVDGDGSDDVVFVEQDFVFGRMLRAVRIEP
jgi:hypothetical protein